MKTRSLIMLSIFTAIAISAVFGYEQYSQSTNNYEHLSSLLNDNSLCFDSSDEKPVKVCYTLDELETFGCNKPLLDHLAQYSNLLDPEFPEMFIIEWPSLPNNVSEEDYDACVEFLNSVRLPSESKSETIDAYVESEPETKNMECIPTDYEKTRKCLAVYQCSVDENPELNKECIETDDNISVREMCSNPDNVIIQQSNGCMVLPLVNSKYCGSAFALCETP